MTLNKQIFFGILMPTVIASAVVIGSVYGFLRLENINFKRKIALLSNQAVLSKSELASTEHLISFVNVDTAVSVFLNGKKVGDLPRGFFYYRVQNETPDYIYITPVSLYTDDFPNTVFTVGFDALYRINLRTNLVEDLNTKTVGIVKVSAYSGDGKMVAYTFSDNGRPVIRIKNVSNGDEKDVTAPSHDTGDFVFSSDDTKLAFLSSNALSLNLYSSKRPETSVVILDLKSGKFTTIDSVTNPDTYGINGWKKDGTVDYVKGYVQTRAVRVFPATGIEENSL